MIVIGINAYHGDSSACIFVNEKLIAAAEEERFVRVKHFAGFPIHSIKFCLDYANINISDVNYFAINRNPKKRILEKLKFIVKNRTNIFQILNRVKNLKKITSIKKILENQFKKKINGNIINVDHHFAHIASSIFFSRFKECNFISVDGFGDFVSTMTGFYKDNKINIIDQVFYPHSLGIFYSSITQYLGFDKYGDEYKVMGLSSYGEPSYVKKLETLFENNSKNLFSLNLEYFQHHKGKSEMTWYETEPKIGTLYNNNLEGLLGPARDKNQELKKYHFDIACSAQKIYEDKLISFCQKLYNDHQSDYLCLTGGCIMNCVANGKILENTKYKYIYVPFAPSDSGGSIGSAAYFINKEKKITNFFDTPYLGPSYSNEKIKKILEESKKLIKKENSEIAYFDQSEKLLKKVAEELNNKKIIGYFSDRMEFGARALGNRSILADPREKNIREILNIKIKKRETFRPFAPSILEDHVQQWFEADLMSPFMSQVIKIKNSKREIIPAVTHVDGTGRLQTVSKKYNENYYNLIKYFYELTNVPMVLNTSFNENEPIVNTPKEALNCFLRTKMDILVLNNFVVTRNS